MKLLFFYDACLFFDYHSGVPQRVHPRAFLASPMKTMSPMTSLVIQGKSVSACNLQLGEVLHDRMDYILFICLRLVLDRMPLP